MPEISLLILGTASIMAKQTIQNLVYVLVVLGLFLIKTTLGLLLNGVLSKYRKRLLPLFSLIQTKFIATKDLTMTLSSNLALSSMKAKDSEFSKSTNT